MGGIMINPTRSEISMKTQAALDGLAITTAITALAGWLPPIAALFSIIWLTMQMIMHWDKFALTVRGWFTKKSEFGEDH